MGKQKRERRKPHKENPTGLPSVKDFEAQEAEYSTNEDYETTLQSVYEEVQSVDIEEILSGLHTIESMAYDVVHAVKIAESGIAKIIGPMLVGEKVVVRACCASTLRTIADNGNIEAQESLLKDDIMTPLCTLLKNYYSDWQPDRSSNKNKEACDEIETLIQAVTLLWTLCEYNELAIKHFNEEDVVSILSKFLDLSIYGIEITTIVMQCLSSISEDNSIAIKKLKASENTLINLLNISKNVISPSEELCLKTAACGLLMNLLKDTDSNPVIIVCKVIHVLFETLSVECKQLLSTFTSILPYEKNSFANIAKRKVQESRRLLGAQQQALEILANICSEDQEDESDSNLSNSDCEDNEMEDILMEDKGNNAVCCLPLEITEAFKSFDIIAIIWNKTKAVDKDTVEILEQSVEGKAVLKQMHILNCRAYICLNNMMSNFEIDMLGGMESIYRMWLEIGTVVFKETKQNDIELLESATAAMRAAIQRLTEANANIFNQLTLDDIQLILNGERQCTNANVRVNLIRILGNLVLILMNNDTIEARELTKHLSIFLLDASTTETQAWVMAEILDVIMDIHGQDNSDVLSRDIKLLEKLRSLVPVFKTRVKQQRKSLGDNIAVVSTVNNNIGRFIKYKETRLKSV